MRLVIEEYGLEIEYIQDKNNIVTDSLSKLTNNGNQKTTQEYNYIMETMSLINDTKGISEGTFPIKFQIIDQYQRKEPILKDKFKYR